MQRGPRVRPAHRPRHRRALTPLRSRDLPDAPERDPRLTDLFILLAAVAVVCVVIVAVLIRFLGG